MRILRSLSKVGWQLMVMISIMIEKISVTMDQTMRNELKKQDWSSYSQGLEIKLEIGFSRVKRFV
jgi:hypothetical protein